MPHVELPRPLEDYFAFTELERHGTTRRFTITLPYHSDKPLGRLQWWWRVSLTVEGLIGEDGMAARQTREVERFRRHIERWLANTGQRFLGDGPIPELAVAPVQAQPELQKETTDETAQRASKVAHG